MLNNLCCFWGTVLKMPYLVTSIFSEKQVKERKEHKINSDAKTPSLKKIYEPLDAVGRISSFLNPGQSSLDLVKFIFLLSHF